MCCSSEAPPAAKKPRLSAEAVDREYNAVNRRKGMPPDENVTHTIISLFARC